MSEIDFNLPEAEYFATDAASNSVLGRMKRSPAHCREYMDNPPESTPAMVLGTLVHTAVLENDKLADTYHIATETDPVYPRKEVVRNMIGALQSDVFDNLYFVDDGNAPRAPTGATKTLAELILEHGSDHDEVKEFAAKIKNEQVDRALAFAEYTESLNGRTLAKQEDLYVAKNYADYLKLVGGKTIIKQEDFEAAQGMYKAVHDHPAASLLLASGSAEVSVKWIDSDHDYPCKARIDFISDTGYLVDLKTTQDASEPEFSRSIGKFGYHRQQAMYTDGYKEASGKTAKGFIFIAVEKSPPYAVGVYALDIDAEDVGRQEYKEMLGTFAECQKTGIWPAYSDQVQQIDLPRWYK